MGEGKAYILMGSNYPDKKKLLALAADKICSLAGACITQSAIYETEAWGFESEESFLNQVILVKTTLSPSFLLQKLLSIEQEMGRTRNTTKYSSRSIDLDILLYNQEIINTPDLQVPHPRMHLRKFVLTPMAELAPHLKHPVLQKKMEELLSDCQDTSWVREYTG